MTITGMREFLPVLPSRAYPAIWPEDRPKLSTTGKACILPDAGRGMGIFLAATRGSGKSRALGRAIAWGDFIREVPLIILDPVGGTIDNLLDKIGRQSYKQRVKLWPRVTYINMNGQDGCVTPWPIYYKARRLDRFSDQSQRFIEVVRRSDPALQHASIQGLNALAPIAHAGGIVLSALGLGITELWDLVNNPVAWEHQLRRLEQEHPETAAAIDELRVLGELSPRDRAARLLSLRSKLSLFRFNPNFRAIFGATSGGINWQEVVEQKRAVLIDFRDIENAETKKFCLLWVYHSFLTFIKYRGHGRMRSPISFIIDELSYLLGSASMNTDLLTGDIDELINRIARSHGIWLTLATQELFQLPPGIRQTVLSMGTVLFGQTSDDQAAEELARRYFRYDPYKVKKSRLLSSFQPGNRLYKQEFITTGEQTTEFTKGEQNYINSRVFLDLEPMHFLIGQSTREGQLPTTLRPITIEQLDVGKYPERRITDKLRSELTRRDGSQEAEILSQIDQRLHQPERPEPAEPGGMASPVEEPLKALPRPAETRVHLPQRPTGLTPLRPPRSRKPPRTKP